MKFNAKKYSVSVLLGMTLPLIFLFVLGNFIITSCKLSKVPYEVFVTHRWIKQKEIYAQEKSEKGRKIVFVSGSNTLFGINTKEIEDALNIPTLNFGLHAGYAPIILYEAEKIINENDIVILPLEATFYVKAHQKDYITDFIASYIISYNKDLYKTLSLSNKIYCIKYLFYKYNTEKKHHGIDETSLYSINCWNQNGDVVCKRDFLPATKDKTCESISTQDLEVLNDKNSYINQFLNKMKERNVKVYFMAPNIIDSDGAEDLAEKLTKAFDKLGVEYLGSPKDSIYPKTNFYDTMYHLNTYGMEYRTKQIIQYLKDMNIQI